jgi:hypothetical protein
MDPLAGLPDFGAALSSATAVAYRAYGGGPCAVLPWPGSLSGLQLSMTRVADDPSAAGAFAMLDLEVACDYPLDEALAAARDADPAAMVAALPIGLGYARLAPAGSVVALPQAATLPIPMGWSQGDGARWSVRLDVDAGEVIKGALRGGSLLFGVRIEFLMQGVAARVPAQVSFVPAALMAQLAAAAGAPLTWESMVDRLSEASLTPALQTAAARVDVAQAVADRLLATYGAFVPAAGLLDFATFTVPSGPPTERLDWDLSQPAPGSRGCVLRLDTVKGLADLDPASLVREVTIPALDLGFRDVALAANLPSPRVGAPAIGVRVSVPPAPPNRPSGIDLTVPFDPPEDAGRATLRLSPGEPLAYQLTPFAVVAAGGLMHAFEAPGRAGDAPFVQLQAADFQLAFCHITASDRLLAEASLDGILTYAFGGRTGSISVKLTPAAPGVSVALPAAATGAVLSFKATTPAGAVFPLPDMAPGRIRLDLTSLPGYGPQRIAVSCAFSGDEPPLTLEFEPQDGVGAASLALAPSAPEASWGYFAQSPFRAGYRFRPAGGAWSDILPAGAPLTVSPEGFLMADQTSTPKPAPPPPPFELDGVRLAADPVRPGVVTYLPASPTPELDTSGRPTLHILKTPQVASLQFGVHFDLPAGGETQLAAQMAQAEPALANARLQPAPVQVRHIGVKLADETGAATEIASSTGSGFPPYAAVFSIPLTPAQAAQAISAVGGRRGVLSVEYTMNLQGSDAALVKDSDIATWFAGTDGLSHVQAVG